MRRRWAAGAKFGRHVVDRLKLEAPHDPSERDAFIDAEAEAYGVRPRTIRRILDGETWRGIEGKRLPATETKACEVCGAEYGRLWANGRRRSDTFWAQKRTCGNSCSVKLAWREGRYDDRAVPTASLAHVLHTQWTRRARALPRARLAVVFALALAFTSYRLDFSPTRWPWWAVCVPVVFVLACLLD